MDCIRTKNHEGIFVIFTEEQRQKKMEKHPELREESFIVRVKETLENPGFIYVDFAEHQRLVYYRYEYAINGKSRYIKVVVNTEMEPYFVITAYRPSSVKERGKTKLIYGEDNE